MRNVRRLFIHRARISIAENENSGQRVRASLTRDVAPRPTAFPPRLDKGNECDSGACRIAIRRTFFAEFRRENAYRCWLRGCPELPVVSGRTTNADRRLSSSRKNSFSRLATRDSAPPLHPYAWQSSKLINLLYFLFDVAHLASPPHSVNFPGSWNFVRFPFCPIPRRKRG